MLCPRCFSEVKIIKNAVYCPRDEIYLDSDVEHFKRQYPPQLLEAKKKAQAEELKRGARQKRLGIAARIFKIFFIIGIVPFLIFVTLYSYLHFLGSNGYREEILTNYGFSNKARWFFRVSTFFNVSEPENKGLPKKLVHQFDPATKSVLVSSANDELAIHGLAHAWWWKINRTDKTLKNTFINDFIKLSGEKNTKFENSSLYAVTLRLSSYCNCPDDNKLSLDEIDADHLFALMSAFTMGKFKDGDRRLPSYMWPYFEEMFTGDVKVATCYEQNNCQHVSFDAEKAKDETFGKIKPKIVKEKAR